MSTTCGFFNSMNKDRMYNATHFGHCFDGIILNGILAAIGDNFVVKAAGGMNITVGSGKAWYLSSWLENDADLPMAHAVSDVVLSRIDAVVMEFDTTETVRWNDVKIIQGISSSAPERPILANTKTKVQIPLAYVYIGANSSAISQTDITSVIGKDECPFVTGILQTASLDTLLGQWEAELDEFIADEKSDFEDWFNQMKVDLTAEQKILDDWIASEQNEFLAWFNQMKNQLGEDAAGSLQNQIDREEINRILLSGFADGSKVFSDDGTEIVSTASDGRTLTKTFTNSFLTITTILRSANSTDVAKMVKNFSADGKLIEAVTTYY